MNNLRLTYKKDTGHNADESLPIHLEELAERLQLLPTPEYVEWLEETLSTLISIIPSKLNNLKISHLEIDDCYYSCDLNDDKQDVHETTGSCTCGADYHNELVEKTIEKLTNLNYV